MLLLVLVLVLVLPLLLLKVGNIHFGIHKWLSFATAIGHCDCRSLKGVNDEKTYSKYIYTNIHEMQFKMISAVPSIGPHLKSQNSTHKRTNAQANHHCRRRSDMRELSKKLKRLSYFTLVHIFVSAQFHLRHLSPCTLTLGWAEWVVTNKSKYKKKKRKKKRKTTCGGRRPLFLITTNIYIYENVISCVNICVCVWLDATFGFTHCIYHRTFSTIRNFTTSRCSSLSLLIYYLSYIFFEADNEN